MRILHINCVYPGGSTGKITESLHRALQQQGEESLVVYGRGRNCHQKDTVKICSEFWGKANNVISRMTGLVYGGCFWQTLRLTRFIRKFKPDIVHLQCINGFFVNIYRLISFLRDTGIPTVLTLHAEFMYTANCGCSYGCGEWKNGCVHCPDFHKATGSWFLNRTAESSEKLKDAYTGFDQRLTVVGVSQWLSSHASSSPLLGNAPTRTIYNGICTDQFYPRDPSGRKKQLGIQETQKVILWVTSLFSTEKGVDYFWELSRRMQGEKYRFFVAGAEKPADYSGNVYFLGKIQNQAELAQAYSMADVSICCSRQESYPTVSIESQCCGTPVVGFDVGGVRETIYRGMGEAVPLGDMDAMEKAVIYWAEQKPKIHRDVIAQCALHHSEKRMTGEYIQLYHQILERQE